MSPRETVVSQSCHSSLKPHEPIVVVGTCQRAVRVAVRCCGIDIAGVGAERWGCASSLPVLQAHMQCCNLGIFHPPSLRQHQRPYPGHLARHQGQHSILSMQR